MLCSTFGPGWFHSKRSLPTDYQTSIPQSLLGTGCREGFLYEGEASPRWLQSNDSKRWSVHHVSLPGWHFDSQGKKKKTFVSPRSVSTLLRSSMWIRVGSRNRNIVNVLSEDTQCTISFGPMKVWCIIMSRQLIHLNRVSQQARDLGGRTEP